MAYAPKQNTLTALAASLLAQMQQQAQVPGQSSSSSVATSTTPAASSLAQIPQHAQAPGQLVGPHLQQELEWCRGLLQKSWKAGLEPVLVAESGPAGLQRVQLQCSDPERLPCGMATYSFSFSNVNHGMERWCEEITSSQSTTRPS